MTKHTPQWRLDIAMMVEALEQAWTYIEETPSDNEFSFDTLRAIELAVKLGKKYAQK